MANPEWGAKRTCLNCGTKFYDFGREPIVCPNCSASFGPDDFVRPRRGVRAEPRAEAAPAARKRGPAAEEEELVDDAVELEADVDEAPLDEEAAEGEDGDDTLAEADVTAGDEAEPEEDEVDAALVGDDEDDLEAELSGEIDTDYRKEDVG